MTTSKPLSIGENLMKHCRNCARQYKHSWRKKEAKNLTLFNQILIYQAMLDYLQYGQTCEYWKKQPKEFFVDTLLFKRDFFESIGFDTDQDNSYYGSLTLMPLSCDSSPFVQTYNASLRSIKKHYLKYLSPKEIKTIAIINFLKWKINKHIENQKYKMQYLRINSHDFCAILIYFNNVSLPDNEYDSFIEEEIKKFLKDKIPELDKIMFFSVCNLLIVSLLVKIN